MALRAGYKGFKKLISPLILNRPGTIEIDGDALNAELNEVFFPRSEQAELGAKNLLKITATSTSGAGSSWDINASAGTVTVTGTASGNNFIVINEAFTFKAGVGYILSGTPEGGGDRAGIFVRVNNADYSINLVAEPEGKYLKFDTDTTLQAQCRIKQGTSTEIVFKPMIRYATDPDTTFVPYAATNSELTASAADQKTAINAIITAATEAADFAAFKTAMGAITPVTRSAAPAATREVTEEVIEEPVTTKKTTRKKSTAEADTEKEGDK